MGQDELNAWLLYCLSLYPDTDEMGELFILQDEWLAIRREMV